jgi:hypothetical protein
MSGMIAGLNESSVIFIRFPENTWLVETNKAVVELSPVTRIIKPSRLGRSYLYEELLGDLVTILASNMIN